MSIIFGGRNATVQIDELLYCHKPKYQRGHAPHSEQWVFGLVDTSSRPPSLGYMELVPKRDDQTLLPIIQAHTHPGTTTYSDQWVAYNAVGQLPTVSSRSTVNHSVHFLDPATGLHTRNVESYWNWVKRRFKPMMGVSSAQLPSYLDEFMWHERWGKNKEEAFANLMTDIASQYPV